MFSRPPARVRALHYSHGTAAAGLPPKINATTTHGNRHRSRKIKDTGQLASWQ